MIVLKDSEQVGQVSIIESVGVSDDTDIINGQLVFQWDESAYAISFSVVSQIQ